MAENLTPSCLGSIPGIPGDVKSKRRDGLAVLSPASCIPGPGGLKWHLFTSIQARQLAISLGGISKNRAERTPGAVAVSGVYGRSQQGVKTPAGIPKTNSEPSAKSGGFSISGAARWLLPGANPPRGAVPGPG